MEPTRRHFDHIQAHFGYLTDHDLIVILASQPKKGEYMKYKFTANFNIEGKPNTHTMEYDSVDIVKTLERRLKTAFPNATGIQITLDGEKAPTHGVK